MSLLPTLSSEIQRSIDELGMPSPVVDEEGRILMIVEPEFTHVQDGYSARIPGIKALGEGDTKEEAAFALQEALRAFVHEFSDQ